MSVLIKGMEMPTKCVSCDLRAFNGIMDECRATRRKMCGFEYQKGFPDWCPLVEVKTPHGRLIDESSIKYDSEDVRCMDDGHIWHELCVCKDVIEDLPTVLEPEE